MGGKGLEMGQTANPCPIQGANFPGAAFVRPPFSVRMATARAQSHFPRAEPRERRCPRCRTAAPRPSVSLHPSPAQAGLPASHRPMPWAPERILRSQATLPCRSGGGHVWHRCHGAGGTRNSPGKRFLTPLPILLARTRHILSLSHSPPKLLALSPSLCGLKWWDTAGTGGLLQLLGT